ncbi:MAG: hypothetical protein HQL76_06100 [Magnetococcales bacterium]|nr:hypothetical protein [Magnetococcales bacterium]
MIQVAALYVETNGSYSGLSNVDLWDEDRDARLYNGPYPVVAHPPCQRWGRYWHGSPAKPHQYCQGDDNGCFAAALHAVRIYGGVLEHPADSHAWRWFGLNHPHRKGGWISADKVGGLTCCVWQGHYGHFAGKPTWLYTHGINPQDLIWGPTEQRIHPEALKKYGYEKARRIGMMAMVGGRDKTRIRNSTPPTFRDLLIGMARTVSVRTKQ